MMEHATLASIFLRLTSRDHEIVHNCLYPEEVSEQYIVDLDRVKFIGIDSMTHMPKYMILPFILPELYVPPVTSYEPPLMGEELKIDQVD